MLDDHKYSVKRIVAYAHPNPSHPADVYGPGGSGRTYGTIVEVQLVKGADTHWEYTVKNSFTGEVCRVKEDEIFHGANRGYLDFQRRDDIAWHRKPPNSAREDAENGFWRRTLKDFVRKVVPQIREKEQDEENTRLNGRNLELQSGDYIKLRGDLRPEMEQHHNLYAKVLSVSPADIEFIDVPKGPQGIACGHHKVINKYNVLVDGGAETAAYDVEIKTTYTLQGRSIVLNWRAATFLAEAFGDHPPYDLQLEYLNEHLFTRVELEDKEKEEIADILVRLLYSKGLITFEEFAAKADSLCESPREYLVDQVLAISRFDMGKNRALTPAEIESLRSEDTRLRELFE